jgi:WS/DGAT/MGAT family acyltransferase
MTKLERLSGVDAAFLYLETPTMHMHIVGVIVMDPSTMPDGYTYERLKALLRSKIHRVPPFYQCIKRVPLDLEHPYWVPDPDFDIDRHVHRIGIPEPGDKEELGKLVGEIAAKPLDRSRPLWELWVVEGLDDGQVALITKMHHAAGDGMASGYLMLQLLSMSPEIPDIDHPKPLPKIDRSEIPTDFELVRHALKDRVKDPVRIYRQAKKTVKRAAGVAGMAIKKGT